MTKNLVIVESPTKSKTIEKFLGKTYTVRASMGHLRDLPKSTFGVDIENNFEPKYINIRGKGDLIKELKSLAKKADKVFLATDPDREGEAISWHLAHILDLDPEKNCRIEFHEITSTAIKDALKNPRPIDMEKVDAQQARRIIDRIVGYKLSPLLWRKIRKGLSAGRVQSVAVKIIADREKEIADFIPQEYWTLSAKLRENSKAPIFEAEAVKYKGKKLEIKNAEQAKAAEEALLNANFIVSEATKKERKRHAAPPFTTSSLQQEANKKLNFTAKKTMMVAQQLYEGVSLGKSSVGLITYMRTDSVRFADSARDDIRNYIVNTFGKEYCPAKPNFYSSKKNAQDAHEAIRPTSVLRTPDEIARHLTKDQLKLYTLIWNRAVASQMSDAVYDVTTLVINAGDYGLRASGAILKFPGHLQLIGKSAEDEKEKSVPYLEAGTELLLHKLMPAEQHFTEPPAHFTEATLVKELEEKGIGRPSTYAPTIQTILDRGYVAKDAKKLVITELGLLTVDMLTKYFSGLINIPFSAEMENSLDEIAENHVDKNEIISKFYNPFIKDLEEAENAIGKVELPVEVSDVPCDKCGRMMVIKDGRFGKFLACPGFPECRNAKPILKKIGIKCPVCGKGDV
ncbi:MAG: type I DNA topoisomerase, partial [Phascolarctobacterium sp.]|nr:type I DNA topoisomerase [Phascolarctobacterium sp.]